MCVMPRGVRRGAVPREPVVAWLRDLADRGWSRQEISWLTGVPLRRLAAYLNGSLPRDETGYWMELNTADRIACATGHHLSEIEEAA